MTKRKPRITRDVLAALHEEIERDAERVRQETELLAVKREIARVLEGLPDNASRRRVMRGALARVRAGLDGAAIVADS
jgi:hypothetical protein